MVVCYDTSAFKLLFEDVNNYIGNIDFKFGNGGDAVRLLDNNNTLVDIVLYDDEDPWPVLAAGAGPTLELTNPYFDNTQVENWQASKNFGSPGRRNSMFTVTAINQDKELQNRLKNFTLMQNYPNPFNPKTIINYELPTTLIVDLSIYNLLGQRIATLVSSRQHAGSYQVEWDASGFSSGIYFYHLRAGQQHEVRKMVFLQ